MTAARTTPSRRFRLLRSSLAAAALATGALTLAAAPAHAEVIDTDGVRIAVHLGKADFGNDDHWFGAPQNDGKLTWNDAGSTRTGTLTGKVYWDDGLSGGCARVKMTLFDSAGHQVGQATSGSACKAGGGLASRSVTLKVSSAKAHRAVITTQAAPGINGPWKSVGSQTRHYGQVGGTD